jgi:hypothetical protein
MGQVYASCTAPLPPGPDGRCSRCTRSSLRRVATTLAEVTGFGNADQTCHPFRGVFPNGGVLPKKNTLPKTSACTVRAYEGCAHSRPGCHGGYGPASPGQPHHFDDLLLDLHLGVLLQQLVIDADVAKLVLDNRELFSVGLVGKDVVHERGLAGPEVAGQHGDGHARVGVVRGHAGVIRASGGRWRSCGVVVGGSPTGCRDERNAFPLFQKTLTAIKLLPL